MIKRNKDINEQKSSIKFSKHWDVHIPAPSNSFKGAITPKRMRRFRRIVVEVNEITPAPILNKEDKENSTDLVGKLKAAAQLKFKGEMSPLLPKHNDSQYEINPHYERTLVLILVPKVVVIKAATDITKGTVGVAVSTIGTAVDITKGSIMVTKKGATAIQSALRKSYVAEDNNNHEPLLDIIDDEDEATVESNLGTIYEDDDSHEDVSTQRLVSDSERFGRKWTTKYVFDIREFHIIKREREVCVAQIYFQGTTRERKIFFDSELTAISFMDFLEDQQKNEIQRVEARLKASMGNLKLPRLTKNIDLLVEIVGAERLSMDRHVDPFVSVILGGKQIHQTNFISKCHDPIFTLKTQSVFLISMQLKELLLHETGIEFIVKDYEVTGLHRVIGFVKVHPRDLITGNGERMVFNLSEYNHRNHSVVETGGKIAIRCRPATDADKQFISHHSHHGPSNILRSSIALGKNFGKDTIHLGMDALAVVNSIPVQSILTRTHKRKVINGQKVTLMKIRPYPDPNREAETEWMASEKIEEEVTKPSSKWKELGPDKGNGRIYLEILGCDGLPNMDTGGVLGNKTDCFVNILFESSQVRTDVIDDCLSPRWLPWTQRAFIFNMIQSNSDIYIGVFDSDDSPLLNDELIGKVTIDVSGFLPGLEYILEFGIFNTSYINKRQENGTIRVRLRLEISNPRSYLLSSITNTSPMYINVRNKKDYYTLYHTLHGKYDVAPYNRDTIWSYIDELTQYQEVTFYIMDAAINVILWRPTVTVYIGLRTFHLPIHSMFAFIFLTYFVEHPELFPSAVMISIGWLLLAIMLWREQHPNPWYRTPNFIELAELFLFKKFVVSIDEIEKDEKKEETEMFEKKWKDRVQKSNEEAKKKQDELTQEKKEADKEIGDTEVDISSKKGGINIDPFIVILYPLQKILEQVCICMRIVRNIITWEEPFMAFWLVVLSFVGAAVCAMIPWMFLLRWMMRIIVWTLFGPWMMIFDRFYYRNFETMTEEEKNHRSLQLKMKRQDLTKQRALKARVTREKAFKLKDAKELMFGKYIAKMPMLKIDRYRDTPLSTSTAKHYNTSELPRKELITEVVEGQFLVGDMIPTIK